MQVFNRQVSARGLTVFGFETVLISGSLLLAAQVHGSLNDAVSALWKIVLITAVCELCFYYNDLYDLTIVHSKSELLIRVLQAAGASAAPHPTASRRPHRGEPDGSPRKAADCRTAAGQAVGCPRRGCRDDLRAHYREDPHRRDQTELAHLFRGLPCVARNATGEARARSRAGVCRPHRRRPADAPDRNRYSPRLSWTNLLLPGSRRRE